MTHEAWVLIAGFALSNVVALVAGLIHIATRLTRIETTVDFIKGNCPQCRPTSENPLP